VPETDEDRVTVLPASADPVNTGVVSFVILLVLDRPVSVTLVISGMDGMLGGVVSIMIVKLPLEDQLPAASLSCT
jgi:hypothetical protein